MHLYLARGKNVDVEMVKLMVNAHPGILLAAKTTKCTPLHALAFNSSIGALSQVVQFIGEVNSSAFRKQDKYDQTPLHIACCNKHITGEIIQCLIDVFPDAARMTNNLDEFPLGSLCSFTSEFDD